MLRSGICGVARCGVERLEFAGDVWPGGLIDDFGDALVGEFG